MRASQRGRRVRMRPRYHISPEHGFLNDPNGLTQFRGKYHVFYQWLPDVVPQGNKQWRHCISDDLVHWTDEGSTLQPKEWYEKNGCYSGSGIATEDAYFLFYTGNVRDAEGGRETYQCVAVSDDGKSFRKKGPLIYLPDGYTAHFRDPKVWKKNDRWWMVVGAQTKELKGNVAIFESNDLKKWDYRGNLLDTSMDWGYMCECPDVMDIEQQFLVVSCQKETGCKGIVFSGRMDYAEAKFQLQDEGNLLDEGLDFYAPQSFADESGRCILIGWLGAGELEYQMSQPTVEEGWLHALTIPRELFIQNGKLHQRPVKEFERIRRHERVIEAEGYTFIDQETWSVELLAEQLSSQKISFNFGNVLKIYFDNNNLLIQRKHWNMKGYDEVQVEISELENIQVFLDQSTAEIFVNNGEKVFTFKAFFTDEKGIEIESEQTIYHKHHIHSILNTIPDGIEVTSRTDDEYEYIFIQNFSYRNIDIVLPKKGDIIYGNKNGNIRQYETIVFRKKLF